MPRVLDQGRDLEGLNGHNTETGLEKKKRNRAGQLNDLRASRGTKLRASDSKRERTRWSREKPREIQQTGLWECQGIPRV